MNLFLGPIENHHRRTHHLTDLAGDQAFELPSQLKHQKRKHNHSRHIQRKSRNLSSSSSFNSIGNRKP